MPYIYSYLYSPKDNVFYGWVDYEDGRSLYTLEQNEMLKLLKDGYMDTIYDVEGLARYLNEVIRLIEPVDFINLDHGSIA